MAIYRLSVQVISRGAGRSAVAAASYRAAARLIDHRTGLAHDYRARSGIEDCGLIGWRGSREALWNAAEGAERHPRAAVAREIVLTIPRELDLTQRRKLVARFAEAIAARHAVAIDWAIHCPVASDGAAQPHAHLMLTTRQVDSTGVFGAKTRELDTRPSGPRCVEEWRGLWADHANAALREIGIDAALDHRSAARRGIGHEPEERLGPAAAAMERRGVRTEIGDRNRRRRRRNRDRERLVAEGNAVTAAIAALEREVVPSNPMAVVDRALTEAATRPGAVAEALNAAEIWGNHAPAILAARVARLSREGRRQVVVACRQLGGHLAGALLDEMVGDAHQRQRVR